MSTSLYHADYEAVRESLRAMRVKANLTQTPDGHPKLLHLWPVKLLQAGRSDGNYTGATAMREAASFSR